MPIRVQCEGCQTVLNVQDQAAGKVIKCRQCGERVKVPMASGTAPAKARAPRPARKSQDPDDLFGDLDLRQAEDTKKKVCPGCTAPVEDGDIECPKCGVNIATGVLSERQRIKRERKGPPPAEFYRSVWGNSWKFANFTPFTGAPAAEVTMLQFTVVAANYIVVTAVVPSIG